LGLLNLALGMQPHGVIVNALAVKDGDRVLLRLGGDGVVDNWLRRHVGEVATIIVPSLGVAWTPKLQRRKGGRIYVRVPNKLRKLFEPLWLSNYPIPVIVSIPLISTPRTGQRGAGDPNRPASRASALGGQELGQTGQGG
jgi:hypothetical protein